MEYEINIVRMQNSISKELLAINEECRNLDDRTKALRKRNKELTELSIHLETAAEIGRIHPRGLKLIYEYFGSDSVKII